MIQCPKCANQLPDWAQNCQFCQTDLKGVARPKPDVKTMRPMMSGPAPWVWPAYYLSAGWFILNGIITIASSIILMAKIDNSLFGAVLGPITYVMLVVGIAQVVIGLGLILKIEFIRGVANIWCWLQILAGARGLLGSLVFGGFFTSWGIVGIVRSVFDIGTAGLIIYLLGETD
jgi:hypothetical protein